MLDSLFDSSLLPPWALTFVQVFLAFMSAWVLHRIAQFIIPRLVSTSWLRGRWQSRLRQERVETVQRLYSSFVTFIVFAIALTWSLNRLFEGSSLNLVWLLGLFAGAFGLGVMPLVKDFFTGITFLFEDPFDVGEKIEVFAPHAVEGVVEHVNLRTTQIRAASGELFTIPNGEIRISRNFSRGLHSLANVQLRVRSADLNRILDLLESLNQESMLHLPNLIEPWQLISADGAIGQTVELKLVAKARFGKAAEMRPRLLAFVQSQLAAADIELAE